MNQQELNYLVKQSLQNAGFSADTLDGATTAFINTQNLDSFEYSESGLNNLARSIETWKESPVGSKFISQSSPTSTTNNVSSRRMTTKEIAQKFKEGSLKFNHNY